MAGNYLSNPNPQFLDLNGDPVPGGAVEFFEAGATTTPLDTFTDKDLTPGNENANPIVLDADGRSPTNIFLQQLSYNVRLLTAPAGSVIWARDSVSNILQVDVSGVAEEDTIAALTALVKATLTNTEIRFVQGHTTKGDDGAGRFQWDAASSATVNTGTIFASDEGGTGRWLRLFSEGHEVGFFGTVGDDVADDAAAIQATVDAAGAIGLVRFKPGRTYRINSGITAPFNDHTWIADGAVINVNFNGLALLFGETGVRHFRIHFQGGKITRTDTLDWTAGNTAVQFLNTDYCSYKDFDIFGFEKGVFLKADAGEGQSYFTGMPTSIVSCKFAIYIESDGAGSFANENGFFGTGSISYTSTDPDASGAFAIFQGSTNSGNIPNNNKFFGLSVENSGVALGQPAGAVWLSAQKSGFFGMRFEGFADPFISGDADFRDNKFIHGRGLNALTNVDTAATGFDFVLEGDRIVYRGGGTANDPMLTLREVSSSTNVGLRIINTAGTTVFETGSDGATAIGDSGAEITRHLSGTVTWNPANTADAAFTSVTVTVTGATVGDTVTAGFSNTVPAGALLVGAVTVGNTVTVTLMNHTGAPLDLASGTLRADVWQH